MENNELAEVTSKIGYEIYIKLKEEKDDFNFIYNSLRGAFTYFIGNELEESEYDEFIKFFYEGLKMSSENLKEHKKDKKRLKQEPEYLFSKELRDRMEKFSGRNIGECLQDPSFFDELMNHAGMTEKEKNDLWKKVKNKTRDH